MNFLYFTLFFILVLFLIFISLSPKKKTTYRYNKTQPLTVESYIYVREYRRQLVRNITKLLDDLNIKFVLSHGNLLEYTRGKPILHDDDVDIRFDKKDIKKWKEYCSKSEEMSDNKYNLVFDERFNKFSDQMINGIQIRLKNFENSSGIKNFSNMDIHADLVLSTITTEIWIPYDIDFNNRREIEYLGEKCYAPDKKDTHKVLKNDYGDNIFWSYRKPDKDVKFEVEND